LRSRVPPWERALPTQGGDRLLPRSRLLTRTRTHTHTHTYTRAGASRFLTEVSAGVFRLLRPEIYGKKPSVRVAAPAAGGGGGEEEIGVFFFPPFFFFSPL